MCIRDRYATDLMACGNKAGQWMFAGTKFQVLNNAIDTSKYVYDKQKRKSVRKEFGVSQTELLVGHVGRFSYPKNHEFLIKIFKAINDKISAKLLLVGNGELMPEIQNEVYKLGLSCLLYTSNCLCPQDTIVIRTFSHFLKNTCQTLARLLRN